MPASRARPRPTGALSRPTPTAKAAALAEWPDGSEFEVGIRRDRLSTGTAAHSGRGRFHTRLATWLATRLVTASEATPRPAPRWTDDCLVAISAAAIANHSFEWSAAAVSRGMKPSSSGLGDSAMASKTSRSRVPRPAPICRMPRCRFTRVRRELHGSQPSRVAKALCAQLISRSDGSLLNLYLTSRMWCVDVEAVRRLLISLCALAVGLALAPAARAELTPWFAPSVGNATQVVSVVGVGGSDAKVDVYERTAAGWQAVAAGIPAHVGEKGMAPETHDGQMLTPMGIFTLDFAFGTAPNPGGGLQYVQVGSRPLVGRRHEEPDLQHHAGLQEGAVPVRHRTRAAEPRTSTSRSTQHAVVMGVNKAARARQRRRVLPALHRRRTDGRVRRHRRRHLGEDHEVAAPGRADRRLQVASKS